MESILLRYTIWRKQEMLTTGKTIRDGGETASGKFQKIYNIKYLEKKILLSLFEEFKWHLFVHMYSFLY